MLEKILKKLNFASVEDYLESEKRFANEHRGKHVERKSPLLVLSFEEIDFLRQYINSHDYGIRV